MPRWCECTCRYTRALGRAAPKHQHHRCFHFTIANTALISCSTLCPGVTLHVAATWSTWAGQWLRLPTGNLWLCQNTWMLLWTRHEHSPCPMLSAPNLLLHLVSYQTHYKRERGSFWYSFIAIAAIWQSTRISEAWSLHMALWHFTGQVRRRNGGIVTQLFIWNHLESGHTTFK